MYPSARLGVRVYPDNAGEWRWTIYAGNGKALAVSSEGYHNMPAMEKPWPYRVKGIITNETASMPLACWGMLTILLILWRN